MSRLLVKYFSSFAILIGLLYSLPVKAEVFISPVSGNIDKVIFKAQPGDKQQVNLKLRSDSDKDSIVQVFTNDLTVNPDGVFSLSSNEIKPSEVGSWLLPAVKNINLSKSKTTDVPINLNVPESISDGEYAGAVSVINVADNQSQKNIQTLSRKAQRVYVEIGKNFESETEVKNLTISNPQNKDFLDDKKAMPFLGTENIIFKWQMENKGNIFNILSLNYKTTLPDGQVIFGKNSYELAPRSGVHNYYLVAQSPYLVGKTSLNIDWTTTSKNLDSSAVNFKNKSGNLYYDINLSSKDLEAIGSQGKKPVQGQLKSNEQAFQEIDSKNQSKTNQNLPLQYVYITTGFLFSLAVVDIIKLRYLFGLNNFMPKPMSKFVKIEYLKNWLKKLYRKLIAKIKI